MQCIYRWRLEGVCSGFGDCSFKQFLFFPRVNSLPTGISRNNEGYLTPVVFSPGVARLSVAAASPMLFALYQFHSSKLRVSPLQSLLQTPGEATLALCSGLTQEPTCLLSPSQLLFSLSQNSGNRLAPTGPANYLYQLCPVLPGRFVSTLYLLVVGCSPEACSLLQGSWRNTVLSEFIENGKC